MADTNSTVTLSLKFALVGGGLQALDAAGNKIGEIVKLEQRLEQQTNRTAAAQRQKRLPDTAEHSYGYSANSLAAQQAAWAAADQADRRARVLGSLYAQRQDELRRQELGSAAETARDIARRREQQRQVSAELLRMGLDAKGDPLPAPGPPGGVGGGVFGMAAAFGRTALGTTAAAIAPFLATHQLGSFSIAQAEINALPFANERQKSEARLRSIPGAGFLLDVGRSSTGFGTSESITGVLGEFEARFARRALSAGGRGAIDTERARVQADIDAARDQAAAFRNFRSAQIDPRIDRSTVQGQKEFELASRLLPLERERNRLAVQRSGLETSLARAAEQEELARERLAEIDREQGDDRKTLAAVGAKSGGYAGQFGDDANTRFVVEGVTLARLKALDAAREPAAQRLKNATDMTNRLRGELDDNAARQQQQAAAQARVRAEDSALKEQQAMSTAERLGRLGVGGRTLGLNALDLAKRLGTDYLPPEVLAAGEQYAPETFRRLYREAGERAKAAGRGAVDVGEAGFEDTAAARRRADRDRNAAQGLEDKAVTAQEARTFERLDAAYRAIELFASNVIHTIEQRDRQLMEANRQRK